MARVVSAAVTSHVFQLVCECSNCNVKFCTEILRVLTVALYRTDTMNIP
jgi:hypothetical protein